MISAAVRFVGEFDNRFTPCIEGSFAELKTFATGNPVAPTRAEITYATNWGLWHGDVATEIHEAIVPLPVWPYMDAQVISLAEHPVDPIRASADARSTAAYSGLR